MVIYIIHIYNRCVLLTNLIIGLHCIQQYTTNLSYLTPLKMQIKQSFFGTHTIFINTVPVTYYMKMNIMFYILFKM